MLRAVVSYRQDDWDDHLAAAEFACNNAPNASTGLSPFKINHGHDPHNPYTLLTCIPDEVPAVADFLQKLQNLTNQASDALVLAKAQQEKYANRSRQEVEYQVGDQVLLSSNHINLASQARWPSKKLQHQFTGPYHCDGVMPCSFLYLYPFSSYLNACAPSHCWSCVSISLTPLSVSLFFDLRISSVLTPRDCVSCVKPPGVSGTAHVLSSTRSSGHYSFL